MIGAAPGRGMGNRRTRMGPMLPPMPTRDGQPPPR